MKDNVSLKWLISRSKKQNFKIITLSLCNMFSSALSVVFALATKGIINGAERRDQNQIVYYAVFLGVVVLLQLAFRVVCNALEENIRARLEMTYKKSVFDKILEKKYDKINSFHSGEIINRLTNDVKVVSDGVTTIVPNLVGVVTRLVCAVVALIILDPVFALVFVVGGVFVFVVVSLLRSVLKNLHKKTQETEGKTRSFMQECIENLLAVKVFGGGDKVAKKADVYQYENFKIKMKRRNYSVVANSAYSLIFNAGYLYALIWGAFNIGAGLMDYGSLTAILQLVNQVQIPFARLSGVLPQYYAVIASTERLIELENLPDEKATERIDALKEYSEFVSVNMENVAFRYDREEIIADSSLIINKGDFVAIKGISGIGKSTLIKLLLGVYDLSSGRIYLKFTNTEKPADSSSRGMFSYVPQGNLLFSGTIYDNITFFSSPVSDEVLQRAVKISCVEDFLSDLPDGLDTVIGENGLGLSEGQVQRIAVARALVSCAPILLLDEATSALDEETEKRLLNNLKTLENVTLIIITHKRGALEICNRRIEIKNKKIREV